MKRPKGKAGRKVIIFAGLGDGFNTYPGRQLLLHSISEKVAVVFLKRSVSRGIRSMMPQIKKVGANLYELSNAYRLTYSRLGEVLPRICGAADAFIMKQALKKNGLLPVLVWLSVADLGMISGKLCKRTIYDCVDPCFIPERENEAEELEAWIAKRVDLIFCTASSLERKLKRYNQNCYLLPNACSSDTIAMSNVIKDGGEFRAPKIADGMKGPIIGYMGTIDWRFDVVTVSEAARCSPDYNFVFVGRINADQEARVADLKAMGNVLFTGPVNREDGEMYAASFSVGLIPFIEGKTSDAINPVKMYMYLAAGKPVVSTWIEECVNHKQWVHVAKSGREFSDALRWEVENDTSEKRVTRMEFGKQNQWSHRAETALQVMKKHGILD